MTGRRRHPRFLLAAPLEGALDVREQVAVERWSEGEIELVSMSPCQIDERVAIELPGDGDGQLMGSVLDCRPLVTGDGSIQYRVRLSFKSDTLTAPDEGRRRS